MRVQWYEIVNADYSYYRDYIGWGCDCGLSLQKEMRPRKIMTALSFSPTPDLLCFEPIVSYEYIHV